MIWQPQDLRMHYNIHTVVDYTLTRYCVSVTQMTAHALKDSDYVIL